MSEPTSEMRPHWQSTSPRVGSPISPGVLPGVMPPGGPPPGGSTHFPVGSITSAVTSLLLVLSTVMQDPALCWGAAGAAPRYPERLQPLGVGNLPWGDLP